VPRRTHGALRFFSISCSALTGGASPCRAYGAGLRRSCGRGAGFHWSSIYVPEAGDRRGCDAATQTLRRKPMECGGPANAFDQSASSL